MCVRECVRECACERVCMRERERVCVSVCACGRVCERVSGFGIRPRSPGSTLLITEFIEEDSPFCPTRAITRTLIGFTPLGLAPGWVTFTLRVEGRGGVGRGAPVHPQVSRVSGFGFRVSGIGSPVQFQIIPRCAFPSRQLPQHSCDISTQFETSQLNSRHLNLNLRHLNLI